MITFSQLREKTAPTVTMPKKADTLGVKRSEMPQIGPNDMKGFLEALKKQAIHVDHREVNPNTLSATQGNFERKKVDSIVAQMQVDSRKKTKPKASPIIVSKDNRVLDGHHRWLAHQALGKPITVARVNKKAGELMAIMKGHEVAAKNKMFEAILDAYDAKYELWEAETCPLISAAYLKEFEKFIDRMFEKFKIDFNFTKHFRERIAHERNDPCITMKEIAAMIQKLYKQVAAGGNSLSKHKDAEAVVKDMQSDLNMPVAIEYDPREDEMRVAAKTIMRKKNFKSSSPSIVLK